MNVRSQVAMVFHLDKCIGCHTCSIACKNIWTDRKGTEYMWWNNVETKPGTGFPTQWENQDKYNGDWACDDGKLGLKSTSKEKPVFNIFHNPNMPTMDDYYEPWTYDYQHLFTAPEGPDQPTARPISMVTGELIQIQAGPNWDDDLGGSNVYAKNDPNLKGLSPEQQQQLFAVEQLVFFYFPRICNHCLNAACVAACPSGALYKRGEDGIVLVDQNRCRGWRACVARIRYLGNVLYDASRIEEVAKLPDDQLVEGQRSLILDPNDPEVIYEARRNGVHDSVIESAQRSPVYKFVKIWKIALPPHIEYRTIPML